MNPTDVNQQQSQGAYATGTYRNLFAENGHEAHEVSGRIHAAFDQLFYGDPDHEAVYFPAGANAHGPLAYICDVYHHDVRSEGMSYGMMIAVQLDKKAEFDALWNWSRTYMYHDDPRHPAYGYFACSLKTDGTPVDDMPAADGEEYYATALYFAAMRWGNGTGIYNYQAEAHRLLADMRHRELITGRTANGVHIAGNLFDPQRKMVRFTPVLKVRDRTDPSYHLPAFYELWALWGPEVDRAFWAEAAQVSRDFFHKTTHPVTGLSPEYAHYDGEPCVRPELNPRSEHFLGDAWRTVMNWSMDWAWWGKDIRQRVLSDRLQAFFESQGISDYKSSFTLDGQPIGSDHSPGLVAMNATAGLAATHERAKKFIEDFWNTQIPAGRYRYYDGTLYLLGMLNCAGQYRIWTPE